MDNYFLEELTRDIVENEDFRSQILSLVKENAHLLRFEVFSKPSPMFDLYSSIEESVAITALERIGSKEINQMYGSIVIDRQTGLVVGLAMLYPAIDVTDSADIKLYPKTVTVAKIVVHEKHRNKGIFSLMIKYLKNNYETIGLTCTPDLVDMYKKAEFNVVGIYGSQIAMLFGLPEPEGVQIALIDDQEIMDSSYGRKVTQQVREKYGDAFIKSLKQLKKDTEKRNKQVKNLYSTYYQ